MKDDAVYKTKKIGDIWLSPYDNKEKVKDKLNIYLLAPTSDIVWEAKERPVGSLSLE